MAFDAFLKIEGIDGESLDDKHKNWIEIQSYSMGVSQMGGGSRSSSGAASAQRADFSDFAVVKYLDKTSPKLFQHCADGKHIPTITLQLHRATGEKQKYMEYKLSDVIVSSYQPGGSPQGGDALPVESVSFNFGKIELIYTATDQKTGKGAGDVAAGWSLVENKKV